MPSQPAPCQTKRQTQPRHTALNMHLASLSPASFCCVFIPKAWHDMLCVANMEDLEEEGTGTHSSLPKPLPLDSDCHCHCRKASPIPPYSPITTAHLPMSLPNIAVLLWRGDGEGMEIGLRLGLPILLGARCNLEGEAPLLSYSYSILLCISPTFPLLCVEWNKTASSFLHTARFLPLPSLPLSLKLWVQEGEEEEAGTFPRLPAGEVGVAALLHTWPAILLPRPTTLHFCACHYYL